MNDNQNLSTVKYCYLTELYIRQVHDDYKQEFLFHTQTHLQNIILLAIDYKSLQRVIHNVTRDDTRINCAKTNKTYLFGKVTIRNLYKIIFLLQIYIDCYHLLFI
ncbi:unnamed protein product [Rotaria sp. Silwood1]|nr:unnamed protein product [Rotaria sp. Silwood1]